MERGRAYSRKIAAVLGAVFGGFGRRKAESLVTVKQVRSVGDIPKAFVDPLFYASDSLKGHRTPAQQKKRRLRKIANASRRRNRT